MRNHWLQRAQLRKARAGFPSDDALALQQMAGDGSFSLETYYHHQYMQNEWLTPAGPPHGLRFYTAFEETNHKYLLAQSMSGTIYIGNTPIQTFVHMRKDLFSFQDVNPGRVRAVDGELDLKTGELILYWNSYPRDYRVVVSYEYDYEKDNTLPA